MSKIDRICIVAIAKNESRFIEEWIAHYLSLGVDQIIIYDNESDDNTASIIKKIGETLPVRYEFWENPENLSPQISAYQDALRRFGADFKWVGFFDVDEMIVIRDGRNSIGAVLADYADDVSAVGVNWLTFGTSGVRTIDYKLVRSTFRFGPKREFGNNHHFKSFVRPDRVSEMRIHHSALKEGRYIHPDGNDLTMPRKAGLSGLIDHSILQLNHYQVKSHEDFWAKIEKGRVCKRVNDPLKIRANPQEMLSKIDRMDNVYVDITLNDRNFSNVYHAIKSIIDNAAKEVGLNSSVKTVTVNGTEVFYRDNGTDMRVINSSMIKGEFNALPDIVKSSPNKFIIDAGGYIGTSAIILAQMFPESTIVSIEPSTDNFAILKMNVERFGNIVPLNAALVATSRELKLFDRRTGSWGFTIVENPSDKKSVEAIESVRGLTIAELMTSFNVKGVDVLKVDIEGGEAELFKSSDDWISSIGSIVVELHDRIIPECTAIFATASAGMKIAVSTGEKKITYNEDYFV